MTVFTHQGIIQTHSGVTDLTINYQSDTARSVTNRTGSHQGTDAYKVILSDLARAVQTGEQQVMASARGLNVYSS